MQCQTAFKSRIAFPMEPTGRVLLPRIEQWSSTNGLSLRTTRRSLQTSFQSIVVRELWRPSEKMSGVQSKIKKETVSWGIMTLRPMSYKSSRRTKFAAGGPSAAMQQSSVSTSNSKVWTVSCNLPSTSFGRAASHSLHPLYLRLIQK
jgi:hypothetical protein